MLASLHVLLLKCGEDIPIGCGGQYSTSGYSSSSPLSTGLVLSEIDKRAERGALILAGACAGVAGFCFNTVF